MFDGETLHRSLARNLDRDVYKRQIEKIVEEMMTTTKSERTTRVIDFDQEGSMEQKKREGYF